MAVAKNTVGTMEKSTEVMQAMNKLVKAPELSKTMMEMQREMAKVDKMSLCVALDCVTRVDSGRVEARLLVAHRFFLRDSVSAFESLSPPDA